MKRYRVFKLSRTRHLTGPDTVITWGHRDFQWKWTSRVYMWWNTRESILWVTKYTAERADIANLDPEPWVSFEGGTGYVTKRYAQKPAIPRVYVELKPRAQYYQTPEYYQEEKA